MFVKNYPLSDPLGRSGNLSNLFFPGVEVRRVGLVRATYYFKVIFNSQVRFDFTAFEEVFLPITDFSVVVVKVRASGVPFYRLFIKVSNRKALAEMAPLLEASGISHAKCVFLPSNITHKVLVGPYRWKVIGAFPGPYSGVRGSVGPNLWLGS
jgi:hypothetical protein